MELKKEQWMEAIIFAICSSHHRSLTADEIAERIAIDRCFPDAVVNPTKAVKMVIDHYLTVSGVAAPVQYFKHSDGDVTEYYLS